MPAPTMLIRPRGPGMSGGAAQVPGGFGVGGGMPKAPAVPQGAAGGTHGGLGVPVQITQRISLRPGGGGPPPGAAPAKPKKETQRFALSPAPTQQAPAETDAAVGDAQRLMLPLGMVLRSLPPEVLSTDVGQLLARPAVAGGTVSVPLDQVLRQLPTGVVQFTFDVLQPQIPADMLQSPDQLATHWDRPIRLPLGEVVTRIPPQAMGRRGTLADQPAEFDSIEAPFRVQQPGPRARRTGRLSAPVAEPAAPAEPTPAMDVEMAPAFLAAEAPALAPPPIEAEPMGFEPFRRAAAPMGAEPPPPAAVEPVPAMPQPIGAPFVASAQPFKAPAAPSPMKPALPESLGLGVQKAPTMGMTGKISLPGMEDDADIQREPTQRLGKPPPGLIAARPPATSALPPVLEGEVGAPADVLGEISEPGPVLAPPGSAQPPVESAPPFGGGLSSLASLAAMADSGPLEPEEEPPAPVAAPAKVPVAALEPTTLESSAPVGAWWESPPGAEAPKGPAEPVAPEVPEKTPLADLATQWLAMQQDAPYESKASPAEAPGPPTQPTVAQPETPAAAKNWWETPLGEPESAESPAFPSEPPAHLEVKEKVPEAPALPADFPAIFVAKTEPRPAPIEPPGPIPAAEPPSIFAAHAVMRPEAAPGFVPPASAAVPDLRRRPVPPPKPMAAPAGPPAVQKPPFAEAASGGGIAPPGGAPILPLTPKVPARPSQPPRPPLVRRPPQREPEFAPEPEPEPESEPEAPPFAFEATPAPARPSIPARTAPTPARPSAPPQPAPAPRKPVTLVSAGRLGTQGRPKGAAPAPQPARETEIMAGPRQRSPIPVPKQRADRMSGLLRAASSWTPRAAITVAARPINPRRILSRWLGLEVEREVPIQQVPALLVNSPHVKGAAIVDEEGMALTSHLPEGVSEQAVGALSSRLFNQLKTAAGEVGSQFANQAIMTLGRWTVQITFEKPFYLVTLHDSPHFPPAVARRMRKIAGALVRQEFGS